MKKLFVLFFYCFFIFVNFSNHEKCVRGAQPYGFFADFLWALNHIEYCLANNKTPVIYWGQNFAYYSPQGYNDAYNGWEYYFEPVSDLSYTPGDYLHTKGFYPRENNFSTFWWYYQYIKYKHLLPEPERHVFKSISNHERKYLTTFQYGKTLPYPIGSYHVYSKQFRNWVYENLIDKFVKIKLPIKNKVEDFYNQYILGKRTIAVHLRGSHTAKEVLPVPASVILQEANKHAQEGVQFFVATDQEPLLKEAQNQLRGPVIYYPCQRFEKSTNPYPGVKHHPKMGEDVLIEMMLLSCCDHFIHTLSCVSTAALYFNPQLEHTLIY